MLKADSESAWTVLLADEVFKEAIKNIFNAQHHLVEREKDSFFSHCIFLPPLS